MPSARVDGSSVYSAAGADLYTSQRILDAERRLVIVAGRRDGRAVDESAVDLAFLEMAANRTALDAGAGFAGPADVDLGARLQHPGFAEVRTPNCWSPHHSCART